MLMLIDTPDPRYGPDRGGDGPGRPHLGVRTVLLFSASGGCLYLGRSAAAVIEFVLLVGSFSLFMGAIFSLWMHSDESSEDEP
ncbi:MAG: hypothetical protein QOH46_1880 [Solirubrobacteraceae bacterium]|jgi:hypothetical protein|nr:hypothetical protein [Solirubrobacteraceae bacterium]